VITSAVQRKPQSAAPLRPSPRPHPVGCTHNHHIVQQYHVHWDVHYNELHFYRRWRFSIWRCVVDLRRDSLICHHYTSARFVYGICKHVERANFCFNRRDRIDQHRTFLTDVADVPNSCVTRHFHFVPSMQGPSVIQGDIGSYPGAMAAGEPIVRTHCFESIKGSLGAPLTPSFPFLQGATVLGVNYGAGGVTAGAQADLLTVYADLSSRGATPMISGLDGRIIYPGVWSCTLYYTLGSAATVTFDAQNNPDAIFILINSGAFGSLFTMFSAPRPDSIALLRTGIV
jgi:hypothetical protein